MSEISGIFSLVKKGYNTEEKQKQRAMLDKPENPLGTISGAFLVANTIFWFLMMLFSLL